VSPPGPTQSGIINTCNKYAQATSGIGCEDFAAQNGITPKQLYAWNRVLGPNGENCGTSLWANEWYCVGVSGDGSVPTALSTSAVPIPSPMTASEPSLQPSVSYFVASWHKILKASRAIECYDFMAQKIITLNPLHQWNELVRLGREALAAYG
jgi:hypothetical protein